MSDLVKVVKSEFSKDIYIYIYRRNGSFLILIFKIRFLRCKGFFFLFPFGEK